MLPDFLGCAIAPSAICVVIGALLIPLDGLPLIDLITLEGTCPELTLPLPVRITGVTDPWLCVPIGAEPRSPPFEL
jgi:hypothetical protein